MMRNDTTELLRSLRHPDADRVDEVFPAALREELLGSILTMGEDDAAARCVNGASSNTPLPGGSIAGLLPRSHRWVRFSLAISGVAAFALVVGLVVAFGTSAPSRGGVNLRLANYTFPLPAGYRLTSASNVSCSTVVFMQGTKNRATVIPHETGAHATPIPTMQTTPYQTSSIASAVSSSGGCIQMLLTPSYTPKTTPTAYGDIGTTSTKVQVGPYQGFVSTQGGSGPSPSLQLTVLMPQSGGQMRDLDVATQGISEATLVQIVTKGLS
jgi:hypothetical protein